VNALQQSPIMVKITEPKGDPTGLSDVLIGALGLSGVLFLLAVVAAAVFGGLLFWLRSRKPFDHWPEATDSRRPSGSSMTSDTGESR
jgi:hypothetical protein